MCRAPPAAREGSRGEGDVAARSAVPVASLLSGTRCSSCPPEEERGVFQRVWEFRLVRAPRGPPLLRAPDLQPCAELGRPVPSAPGLGSFWEGGKVGSRQKVTSAGICRGEGRICSKVRGG